MNMKRWIHASSINGQLNSLENEDSIVSYLQATGIDTTRNKYQLKAATEDREGRASVYYKTFICPGDWLAYLSMWIHNSVNSDTLSKHFKLDRFKELVDDCPTVDDMFNYAASNWWGDVSNYIIYLKNLTTGETLYSAPDPEDKYEE